jgi:hypothetical protein
VVHAASWSATSWPCQALAAKCKMHALMKDTALTSIEALEAMGRARRELTLQLSQLNSQVVGAVPCSPA